MNLIVCVDQNYGIGKNGDLLAKIPEDLKFFRKMTLGKTIIMGRITFFSFPNQQPLKNREHIVLSRNMPNPNKENVSVCRSLEEVFKKTRTKNPEDLFVIGGEKVYREFLPKCSKAYVTKIYRTFESDTYFVNLDQHKDWQLTHEGELHDWEGIPYRFCEYEKI